GSADGAAGRAVADDARHTHGATGRENEQSEDGDPRRSQRMIHRASNDASSRRVSSCGNETRAMAPYGGSGWPGVGWGPPRSGITAVKSLSFRRVSLDDGPCWIEPATRLIEATVR